MAARKTAPFRWSRAVVSTEGSPVVIADRTTLRARAGNPEGAAGYVDIDAGAVLLDTEGGGAADVGVRDDEVIVLVTSGDLDERPKARAAVVKAIESAKHDEFLVGTISVDGDLFVDDAASVAEPVFSVPWKKGRYTVVEGHLDEDGEARWCRIVPEGRRTYTKRPVALPRDPVEAILARVSFAGPKEEARAIEAALELVALGRPDLALELCAKASPARRVLATWTRVLALAASQDPAALPESTMLTEEWLRPADSAEHASQVLPRAHVLRMLEACGATAALRTRVTSAPEPAVFVEAEGDFF